MKLATVRHHPLDESRLVAVVDVDSSPLVVDIAQLGAAAGVELPSTMLEFIDLGPTAIPLTADLVANDAHRNSPGVSVPLANVELLAPIPRPRKNMWGIGLNYAEHVAESARSLDTAKEMPDKAVIFCKPPNTVCAPGQPIVHNPELTQQLDWEVELAAVIGTRAKQVSADDAMSYVFGYTVMIDVSARDARRSGQWIVSKGQDTYGPMGPWIVTADEIADPHNLDLSLTKNGETKQSSNTKHMYFKIPALIEDISQGMTMDPGDVILTGTPEGVGAGMDPQEWMWPGDTITATVEGIGSITHPIVGA